MRLGSSLPRLVRLVGRTATAALIALSIGCSSTQTTETKSELVQRARAGDIDAQYQLGRRYADSVFGSEAEAIYWLCRAAKDGHVPAQLELAELYQKNAGGSSGGDNGTRLSNKGSAYFWYTAAASQGSDQALQSRDLLAANMDETEILDVKRKATKWSQAVCVKP